MNNRLPEPPRARRADSRARIVTMRSLPPSPAPADPAVVAP
jgi:hypothetical protein